MLIPSSPRWRRLFSAYVASTFGDQFTRIALLPKVGGLGGSLVWLVAVALAQTAPVMIIAPIAGYLSDRGHQRRYLIAADLSRAGILVALAFIQSLPIVAVGAAAIATFTALFRPIEAALEADLLAEDELTRANAARVAANQTLSIAGPALAGLLLIWLSPSKALLIDALSFLISAVVIAGLPADVVRAAPAGTPAASLGGSMREGFAYIAGRVDLRTLFAVLAITMALLGMQNPLFYGYVQQSLRGDGPVYGLLISALGVGGLLASLVVLGRPAKMSVTVLLATLCFDGVALLAFSFSRNVILSTVLMVALGAIGSVFAIAVRTYLQTYTAPRVRGRVLGTFLSLQAPIEAVSLTVGLFLAGLFPAWLMLRGGAVCEIAAAVAALIVMYYFGRDRTQLAAGFTPSEGGIGETWTELA
ncbi:MAG: MFS transporter [Candidatus Eremiobacteraeota bacterium]|nr:MFS transporter [Candidatus Eremiobacteraeota bacterium]